MIPKHWPRVRSKTGQVSDPPEWAGKFIWSIWVVIQSHGVPEEKWPVVRQINSYELDPPRIFETEKEAQDDSKKEGIAICELLNKALGGNGDEGLLDLRDDMRHKTKWSEL